MRPVWKGSIENRKNAWLLIKTEADIRPIPARADDRSIQSGPHPPPHCRV
jgi:hypothetical protein